MINFKFSTVNKINSYNFDLENRKIPEKDKEFSVNTNFKYKKSFSLKNKMYDILADHLNYLNSRNLIPDLNQEIDIIFTNVNFFERIRSKILKKLPEQYYYLACADPANSKIFLSSSFLTHTNYNQNLTNVFNIFTSQFESERYKSLEKEFLHELGHIVINKKYKKKENYDDGFKEHLKIHIEEGFCEAFSLHLMSLKYPNQKWDKLKKFLKENSSIYEKSPSTSFNGIYAYNIYRIYDDIPLKDESGNIITDINQIISTCFKVSLKNNKDVLLEKMNDIYLKAKIQSDLCYYGTPTNTVEKFHQNILKDGISSKISTLREKNTINSTKKINN